VVGVSAIVDEVTAADGAECKTGTSLSPKAPFTTRSEYWRDYVRLCKIVGSHPDGLTLRELAREIYGDDVDSDGADPRYQRVRRFVADRPDYFEYESDTAVSHVRPTLDLISLILGGIIQNSGDDDYQPGKDWCRNLLKTCRPTWDEEAEAINWNLNSRQKWHLQKPFEDYVNRTNDLRIILEAIDDDTDPEYLSLPYATRFTDDSRVKKQHSVLNSSLEAAADDHETAMFGTLTTDPKHFDNLFEAITSISDSWNRFMSWLSTDSRLGYRPEYCKVLEFQESGNPHIHFIIFLKQPDDGSMPWLVHKGDLDDYWAKYQGGYVNDLQPLVYQDDLHDGYDPDEGWVKWQPDGCHGGLLDRTSNDGEGYQTAGQYIGKYLSKTFGLVEDISNSDDPFRAAAHSDDADPWKLALYWATDRKVKTISRSLRQQVESDCDATDDDLHDLGDLLASDYRVVGAFAPADIPVGIRFQLQRLEDITADDDPPPEVFGAADEPPDSHSDEYDIGGYKV
jgi:hypothetical protein